MRNLEIKGELQPIFEGVQSYYGKAKIVNIGRFLILKSYETEVCTIDTAKHTYTINEGNSQENFLTATTLRHIKEFLKQYFYNKDIALTKKELLKNAQ